MKTFIKITMLLLGLRLVFAAIFEHPSLFVGFIGAGLTAFCISSLVVQYRERKEKR